MSGGKLSNKSRLNLENKMKYLTLVLYSFLICSYTYTGEHPEHPEHPTKKAPAIDAKAVGKAVAKFITSDANLKGGKFLIFDTAASEVLQLDLLKIHMDRLTGIGNDIYFACADFQASNGKVYDLDIFMNGKSANDLNTTEIIVHKEEGVERYGWREEGGIWVRVKK